MRYLLPLALLLAACGSSNTPLDGGTDVLPTDAPSEAAPSDALIPADVATDAPADVATDVSAGCVDADGDGYGTNCTSGPDCNDADPAVHPGAMERCDGVDSNCDGVSDTDGSAALNAYCASTAPMPPNPPGAWNGVMPTCRYPGDPMTAAPVTAATCEASYFDSRNMPHFTCWRVAGSTIACPMP